jgi:hypothetical protein
MRRTLMVGFTITALVGMSALVALASSDTVYTPRAPMGPLYGGKVMVKRNDLGSTSYKNDSPGTPTKPHPVIDGGRLAGGGSLGGHVKSSGGGVAMASASPQFVLENRLKSLANDLR